MMLARDMPTPETCGVSTVYAAGEVMREGVVKHTGRDLVRVRTSGRLAQRGNAFIRFVQIADTGFVCFFGSSSIDIAQQAAGGDCHGGNVSNLTAASMALTLNSSSTAGRVGAESESQRARASHRPR